MNIKIKSLEVSDLEKSGIDKDYRYKDVSFDLEPTYSYNNKLNKKENLKDIQAIYDIEAIQTSVSNAFLTAPGQKILNPTFGVDLRRFLFEPVSVYIEEEIEDTITAKLPRAEPRIELEGVTVNGDEDAQEYAITLQINVPSLGIRGLSIKSKLNSNGYTIL